MAIPEQAWLQHWLRQDWQEYIALSLPRHCPTAHMDLAVRGYVKTVVHEHITAVLLSLMQLVIRPSTCSILLASLLQHANAADDVDNRQRMPIVSQQLDWCPTRKRRQHNSPVSLPPSPSPHNPKTLSASDRPVQLANSRRSLFLSLSSSSSFLREGSRPYSSFLYVSWP